MWHRPTVSVLERLGHWKPEVSLSAIGDPSQDKKVLL